MHGRSEDEEEAGPVPFVPLGVDVSSVVTQVTKQNSSRPPTSSFRASSSPPLRLPSWPERLKSFLCCFAPERGGYLKAKRDKLISRPPRPTRSQPLLGERMSMLRRLRPSLIADDAGPKRNEDLDKPTLVLDLDETLVHSSFKPIPNPDYIIPVEIDGKTVDVYVLKVGHAWGLRGDAVRGSMDSMMFVFSSHMRTHGMQRPWLDHFMARVAEYYEVVVFTASLAKYADPLMDMMDKAMVVRWRLFRESCCPYEGNYVKDLSWLGRDLSQTIIIDNSPHSYVFQPQNALPIGTFIDDMEDRELLDMVPMLEKMRQVDDVRIHLSALVHNQSEYL